MRIVEMEGLLQNSDVAISRDLSDESDLACGPRKMIEVQGETGGRFLQAFATAVLRFSLVAQLRSRLLLIGRPYQGFTEM
jgi:hypothetical protein